MARLIPELNLCLPRMMAGQKRLARRFEALLEDDYLIWYDLPPTKAKRHPDFMLLHPARGLLFLEVRDWKAEQLRDIGVTTVELLSDSGLKHVPNPMEAVRQHAAAALQQLERDPQLKHPTGQSLNRLCFPYGYGVVLPNLARAELEASLSEEVRHKVLPEHRVLCRDDLDEAVDAETFQNRLWGMFQHAGQGRLTLPQINRIRWHLFPELRISSRQGGFFDETPAPERRPATLKEELPALMRVLDLEQEQLARNLGGGHRVVHGVAGSGKTLILGYRCLQLAEEMHRPILVLCFNIVLAARLRCFIREKQLGDKVQVYHFHDWCAEQLRTYQVDMPRSAASFAQRQVSAVIGGVAQGQIPKGQYGALLIDEGHEFEPEWLRLVSQMVDPETNSLLLLYDQTQQKHRKPFSFASVGIQAPGRTTILRLNYRNTREILQYAYDFAEAYFTQPDPELPLLAPQDAGARGDAPQVRVYDNLEQEVESALAQIDTWHREGVAWHEIGILYPGGSAGTRMAKTMQNAALPFFWLATSSNRKQFQVDADVINLLPIGSSKGLEFERVIILDSSWQSKDEAVSERDPAEDIRQLYVGLTRARSHLVISLHRHNAVSTALRKIAS
ncbi:MAG TPA: 3'-5' exonuclease [Hyphomicrobiales bacterium]|nr:3'-5' exonuclease [Hyphomicrobiales bacterium]